MLHVFLCLLIVLSLPACPENASVQARGQGKQATVFPNELEAISRAEALKLGYELSGTELIVYDEARPFFEHVHDAYGKRSATELDVPDGTGFMVRHFSEGHAGGELLVMIAEDGRVVWWQLSK